MSTVSQSDAFIRDTRLADSFYSKYEIRDLLGSGASSTVRRCVEKDSRAEYAVKILDLNSGVDTPQLIYSECMREVAILRRVIGHHNITNLHDVFEGDAYIFLVSEICSGGELFDYLTSNVTISEKRTRNFMNQLFSAVNFIHERNIVHRDLKPENILLDERLQIKVTDFGLAVFTDDESELREVRGTPGYLAPEVLMCGYYNDQPPYGQPVDIWACGVIMYTLLVGCPPFWNRKEHLMLRQIMAGQFTFPSPEWDDISESAKDLIRQLLVVSVKDRLTAKGALQHKFFLLEPVPVAEKFEAKQKFRVAILAVGFIFCLRNLKVNAAYLHIQQLTNDPYANKKLRKLIDTLSYDIYSQWIKKGEEQNRAALFENAPRRDLLDSSKCELLLMGDESKYRRHNFDDDDDRDGDFHPPIRVQC